MMRGLSSLVLAGLVLVSTTPAHPQAAPPTPPPAKTEAAPKPAAKKPAAVSPKRFASPEEAMQAFVAAMRADDTKALLAILGSGGRALLFSGDPVADRENREKFVKAYEAGNKLVATGDTAVLRVGADEWPFPIPLVKDRDRWRFDTAQGRQEILTRVIGRNELYAIQTCLAVVDAQREYYGVDRDGDGILEYAQTFASAPGKRDGLYWPTAAGEPESPLGELVTRARAEGYRRKGAGPTPYHGYVYRILTAQGPAARDGAYDYVSKGHMIGGFGVVAFPAQYGVSGVMTFLVNHDGVVYQKDLGRGTRATALAMKTFNPDGTWTKAEVPELSAAAAPASR
jgi:hypothetical protein